MQKNITNNPLYDHIWYNIFTHLSHSIKIPPILAISLALLVLLSTGCSTIKTQGNWANNMTYIPSITKLKRATIQAATDPQTWIPTAAAAALHASQLDKPLSHWASKNTPIFQSRKTASKASNLLLKASRNSFIISALTTPSGNEINHIIGNKVQGLSMEVSALYSSIYLTNFLKDTTKRERPSRNNFTSFPSGHSSSAFTFTTLAKRNINVTPMQQQTQQLLSVGLTAMATGTAWARVEANLHYTTDVLIGAALGNFVANFFYNAFIHDDRLSDIRISIDPINNGAELGIDIAF